MHRLSLSPLPSVWRSLSPYVLPSPFRSLGISMSTGSPCLGWIRILTVPRLPSVLLLYCVRETEQDWFSSNVLQLYRLLLKTSSFLIHFSGQNEA